MAGTSIMAGICTFSYPSSYPTENVGDSPYPYPYPVNAGFPSKRGRIRTIPTKTGLFAISTRNPIPISIHTSLFIFFLFSLTQKPIHVPTLHTPLTSTLYFILFYFILFIYISLIHFFSHLTFTHGTHTSLIS